MNIYQSQKQWENFNESMSNLLGVECVALEPIDFKLDDTQKAPSPNKGLTQEPTRLGIKHTDNAKRKISERMKGENHPMYGKSHSDEMKKMISERTRKCMPKDYKLNQETKNKMSLYNLNAPKVTCPHCDKKGHYANMARWHGDNCKHKK